jgi:DNA-binding NarL/FixJ family response regulator
MPQALQLQDDRISVLVITPDNITAELLRSAFNRERKKSFAVQMLTGSSQKVIGKLTAHKPQVALICDELQDSPLAGFKVLHKLRESHQGTAAVMLLQSCKPDCVVEAFREGARGVFSRAQSLKALSKCIRTVHQGQYWANNQDLGHIMNALSQRKTLQFNNADGMPLLTRREEDVVRLVADGMKNGEIANSLNLAEHSIRNYLYRIFDKLGVSSRVELILYTFNQRDRANYASAIQYPDSRGRGL